jgi:hypothetical protein
MSENDPQFTEDEKTLLAKVPVDGSAIGNGSLRTALKWDVERYLKVKQSLIRKDVIRPGRGRGGSVSRTTGAPEKKMPKTAESKPAVKEKNSYPIFRKALDTWAADQAWTDFFVEHKATQGSRNTGGMWTRPDFVVVGYKKYEYTPGVTRDIETFEIKTADYTIDAVFETASHSRFATQSYLAIYRADHQTLDDQLLIRTESECQRFGIGLLVFDDKSDPGSWDWRLEAVRKEPDPGEVEEYISKQFDDENKKRMRNWF